MAAGRQLLLRRRGAAAAARWRRGYSSAGAAEYLHRSIVPTMHYQKSLPRYGGTLLRSLLRPPDTLPSRTARPAASRGAGTRPGASVHRGASVAAGPGAAAEGSRRAGSRGEAGRGRWRRRRQVAVWGRRPRGVRCEERKVPSVPFLYGRARGVLLGSWCMLCLNHSGEE